MGKPVRRDIAAAVRRAGRSPLPAVGATVPGEADATPLAPSPPPAPKPRPHRQGRQGVLVYIAPALHRRLKPIAFEERTTMQELVAKAIEQITDSRA